MRSQSDGTVRRADDVRFIHCRWEGRKMQAQESGASTAAMHRTAGRTGKNRAAGLTVLELLITLTVASVLTSIAIPSYQRIKAQNRLATSANQLRMAKEIARKANGKTSAEEENWEAL